MGQFFKLECCFCVIGFVSGGSSGFDERSFTADTLEFVQIVEFVFVEGKSLDSRGVGEFAGPQLHQIVAEVLDGRVA